MLLARAARTPRVRPQATTAFTTSWARALVHGRVTWAGETTASWTLSTCTAFASNSSVTWRGMATAASQAPRSFDKSAHAKLQRDKSNPATQRRDHRVSTPSSPPHRVNANLAASSDEWRKPVEEFERRVHVHGKDAGYTADEVHDVVKACMIHGRHREAQSVARKARSLGIALTPETQAELCALQARKGNVDAAFDTVRELLVQNKHRASTRNAKLFDPLLSVLKDQHDWQSVRRAVQILHEFQIEPPIRVFRVLMIAAAKARQKDVLLKTVAFVEDKFRDEPVDLATLTAMCQALTEVGETRKVLDRYHTMDQDWLEANGTTILFNNFVLAALRGGRINKALEIFERMKVAERYAPDDFTFATCILEFEKRSEWDQVIRFFNEMLDREMKGISHAQSVNALSCAAVVRALHNRNTGTSTGDATRDENVEPRNRPITSKKAIERGMRVVLQRLDRVEIRHFGHAASLVDALETYGFRTEAQQLFTRMVDEKVIQTPWLRQQGFEVDLHSFSRGVAKCAVVYAFQQARARAAIKKVDDLRVITGVGKRSRAYLQPVVPDDITELLVRSFRPLIRPMAHPTNPGVLLIRSKLILQWLADGAEIRHFE